jgi:hypothetical protein
MARLKSGLDMTGKIGNLSTYKRKDMDATFVRTPGGASAKKIKKSESFARTRENNIEWIGCGRGASRLRWAVTDIRHLADNNITSEFTRMCKRIQLLDTVNPRGERSILFSKHRDLFEGFRLTQKNPFDGVVRIPLKYGIDKEAGTAWVEIPNLYPEINFYVPWKYPLFRFVITLQAISDVHYAYSPHWGYDSEAAVPAYTLWHPVGENFSGQRVEVSLKNKRPENSWNLVLSAGLEIGTPLSNYVVNIIKRTGCAKILTIG